jgi:ribonuclease HI
MATLLGRRRIFEVEIGAKKCILFFDGGVARAGGIIVDPKGNEENSFLWGLGRATTNQDEAFALFQGLRIADDRKHRRLTIIGDLN